MYTPNNLPELKNKNGHSKPTMEIMQNAVHVGKFTETHANDLLGLASPDQDVIQALKDVVRKAKIEPDRLEGQYHPTVIKTALKSWDEIQSKEPGGTRSLKQNAPELYKAKFFEKHGRMPADLK